MDDRSYILVIGGANLDIVGQPDEPFIKGSSVKGHISMNLGGVARNIAHNLARLDVETVLLTAVGDDEVGESILGRAAGSGIDISHSIIAEGEQSGTYMAILDDKGASALAIDTMRVLRHITPDFILRNETLIMSAQMVVIDANLSKETIRLVVELCEHYEVPLCADPTSSGLANRLKPFLGNFLMISPNPLEAEAMTGIAFNPLDRDQALAAARDLVGRGPKMVVITMGEHGAVYASGETAGHIPAIMTDIVNATGAGDAMTAAIIFGLTEGIPLDESVRLGVTAATLTLRTKETVRPDLTVDLLYNSLVD